MGIANHMRFPADMGKDTHSTQPSHDVLSVPVLTLQGLAHIARAAQGKQVPAVGSRAGGEQWWHMRVVRGEWASRPVRTSGLTAALGPVPFAARRARGSSAWHASGRRLRMAQPEHCVMRSVLSTAWSSVFAMRKFARSFARSVRILTSLSQPMLVEREHPAEPSRRPTLRKSRFQLRGVPPRNGLTL